MQERGQNDAWKVLKKMVIKMFERDLNDARKQVKIMQEKASQMIKTAVVKSMALSSSNYETLPVITNWFVRFFLCFLFSKLL